jgi:beta-glucosidase
MESYQAKARLAKEIADEAKTTKTTADADGCLPDFTGVDAKGEKTEVLLSRMTLGEKIDFLSGIDNMAVKGIARLSMPRVWCSDAVSGIRNFGPGTSFPASLALTASWDRGLIRRVAEAVGEECRAAGVSILLGPGVNIYRIPTNGRNFEYMGEDPFLSGEMAASYVRGLQERGVAATVKHLACNNSEYDRHRMNSVVDERTLHEIYLEPFRKAVAEGGALAVMTSYNYINGVRGSEHDYLIHSVLRGKWGFSGLVMSDWTAVYSAEKTLVRGLDLEMPNGMFLNRETILPLIESGRITEADIDSHVKRILRTIIEIGAYERPAVDTRFSLRTKGSRDLARRAAEESAVLLKNTDSLLPLDPAKVRMIAVVGPNAKETPTGGGGAAYVEAENPVGILDGLLKEFGPKTIITFVGDDRGGFSEADAKSIRAADAVIACAGYNHVIESESFDRSWVLPDFQERLLLNVTRINPRTIVVVNSGGDYDTSHWIRFVPALIQAFYLGVEGGTAVAGIVSGRINPSGKLPFTFARRFSDHPATANYPRNSEETNQTLVDGPEVRVHGNEWPIERRLSSPEEKWDISYDEGIFVGYRHFDAKGVEPLFPFGFGLSYTSFALSDASLGASAIGKGQALTVRARLRNTGERRGAETVQVYVKDTASRLPRPDKELKGFEKVVLEAGAESEVAIVLPPEAFRYYDDREHDWISEPGEFEILIGTSSREVISAGSVELR